MMGLVEVYSGRMHLRSVDRANARAGFDTVAAPRRERANSAFSAFTRYAANLRRRRRGKKVSGCDPELRFERLQ